MLLTVLTHRWNPLLLFFSNSIWKHCSGPTSLEFCGAVGGLTFRIDDAVSGDVTWHGPGTRSYGNIRNFGAACLLWPNRRTDQPELRRRYIDWCSYMYIWNCYYRYRPVLKKDSELSDAEKKAQIKEFNFQKGIWVAFFAGVMSACFAFGIAAGKSIAETAVDQGAVELMSNSPVFLLIMAGGFTTNLVWCLYLGHQKQIIP